ncbi:MAG: hypothetical protein U1E95_09095 [Rubrivivax sp.]
MLAALGAHWKLASGSGLVESKRWLRTPGRRAGRRGEGANEMPKTLPMILQWGKSFDIGSDTLTGVDDADCQPPFALTVKLNKLTLRLDRPQPSQEETARLDAAIGRNAQAD